jgi:hypothetical protein
MASAVFPAPAAASTIPDAFNCTSGTLYESIKTFGTGIYTITCINTTIAIVEFYSDSTTIITSAITSSGTVTVNLSSAADRIKVYIDNGTDVPVIITKTAGTLISNFSGTLDTITTTSTYTGTSTSGYGYAVVVGGGGGGGNSPGSNYGGGGAGGVGAKLVALTGSMSVVIGQGGAANTNGGNTTFAGITAGGGTAGSNNGSGNGGLIGTVTGATYVATGGNGAIYNGTQVSATTKVFPFVINGTTGGGGADGSNSAGDGVIGKGARTNPTTAAAGYGGGGAGHANTSNSGGPGVVYVLRF